MVSINYSTTVNIFYIYFPIFIAWCFNCTTFRKDFEEYKPNIDKFVAAHNTGKIRGVLLTIKGGEENGCVDHNGEAYDFVSRYFAPWVGITEDPVTGKS